jgi:glycosyltransferase involved in cell wall biosynthesis
MKISFVVLTWNRHKFLEICLEALVRSIADPLHCEIVVLDNGSTDETAAVLGRYAGNPLFRSIVRRKNYGINAYKKLFSAARGEFIVEVDDDVLEFPFALDRLFLEYMQTFKHYGLLALNVVQNDFTNGAKPGPEQYIEETLDGKTIERGPTGGWCSCFRKRDYLRLWPWRWLVNLDMKRGEDGFLVDQFDRRLGLRSGIIRDHVCFHASGPYYAKLHGHLDREIEKYANAGLSSFVETYRGYKTGGAD